MTDEQLKEVLEVLDNAPVVFGLEAQGHIPTIQAMRADGKSWREIGDKIGWMAGSAEEAYLRWCERELRRLRAERVRLEAEWRAAAESERARASRDFYRVGEHVADAYDTAADALKTLNAKQPLSGQEGE